ncbi:hypothetical protein LTR36_007633 [Oleoguttula mirabilis]|uniref:Uncharacterized protein n=1 Tax=Oleoguttula mirabilis TaxID=1507867 RepID=A0AAV9JUE2_9PEZI|nr:hypothetical protein LTR36_007633 [Oleoguttula mirabilis]
MSNRGRLVSLSNSGRHRAYGPTLGGDEDEPYSDAQETRSVTTSADAEYATGSSFSESARDDGASLNMFTERSRGFDDMANKHLRSSDTALMIRSFEKQTDIQFARTYRLGHPIKEALSDTVEPKVGFVFLPGADMPEVNRLEQDNMVEGPPDQRDALWRVNTAETLLSEISVGKDLSMIKHDRTTEVVQTAVMRHQNDRSAVRDRKSRGEVGPFRPDAVTLASRNVAIYHTLCGQPLDLCATLIEVNVGSLFELMYDYRWIILNSGLNLQQTKDLLERMIEAARRFCLNSPILFRMSTRNRIVDATNIRFGVDSEQSLETHTTSRGIQEIIMMSASYFNSLAPTAPGMDESTQRIIRPRFLQMLTLLLSLLNDRDVESIASFLEGTYGIKAARADLELLFCKVIPLTSINSTVFLKALIPAIDAVGPNEVVIRDWSAFDDQKRCWNTFMRSLARKGYLLPGTLDDLGHAQSSWIMKWPDDGVKSSTVFGRLQHHGERTSTFNEIPPGRFSYSPEVTELTVIFTNHDTYTIHPQDYTHISMLTRGTYSVTRCEDSSAWELEVTEVVMNTAINDGIRVLNDAIRRFNAGAAPKPLQRNRSVLRKRIKEPALFPEVPLAPRLTRIEVWLPGTILAVAYKADDRNVPKADALRHMTYHYSRLMNLFKHLCESAGRSVALYEQYIGHINRHLSLDREECQKEKARGSLSSSPIARAFNPEEPEVSASIVWYGYWVALRPHTILGELLHIQAKSDIVQSVGWRRPVNWLEIQDAVPTQYAPANRRGRNFRGPEEHQWTAFA